VDSTREKIGTVQDYQRLRERAIIQELVSRLTNAPIELLSYDDVRRKLHIQELGERGIKEIPLDKIVGSVGRYRDFTRSFLPRGGASERRWVDVKNLAIGPTGWPPIEVYQVDDVYFVRDGNHRVSVAKEMGWKSIQAYVIECATPVSLTADLSPADIIQKQDEADFLTLTKLNRLRPEHSIKFTLPGRYDDLLAHIAAHQYFLDQQAEAATPWEEAVASWYDQVYLPLAELIKERNLLAEFPHRTVADLYSWVVRHELELRRVCAVPDVDDVAVIEDFAALHSERPIIGWLKTVYRWVRNLLQRIFRKKPPVCKI
jgi:hypothetical protein